LGYYRYANQVKLTSSFLFQNYGQLWPSLVALGECIVPPTPYLSYTRQNETTPSLQGLKELLVYSLVPSLMRNFTPEDVTAAVTNNAGAKPVLQAQLSRAVSKHNSVLNLWANVPPSLGLK
jgi:hypothetical protein